MNRSKLFWRTNNQIRAGQLRVVDATGKQIGILSLEEALKKAREENLDLIEIAPQANPPVAKIMEFGKFQYQEEKKAREAAQKAKPSELKEVRFSPFIAEGDFQTRFARVKEFLAGGDKVKLVVVFKGRQLGSKGFGYELLARIQRELGNSIATDMTPKFLGRHLAMIVSPLKKKVSHLAGVGENKQNEENKS